LISLGCAVVCGLEIIRVSVFDSIGPFLLWIFQSVEAHWLDVIQKLIVGSATAVIIFSAKRIWATIRALFRRATGPDLYHHVFGLWYVYRVSSSRGVLDTTIRVKRKLFSDRPKCIFTTRHTGATETRATGDCLIQGANLVLMFTQFQNPDASARRSFGTFGYWIVDEGASDFQAIKVGYLCGIMSNGDIATAPVIMSRNKLDHDRVEAVLIATKRLNANSAVALLERLNKPTSIAIVT